MATEVVIEKVLSSRDVDAALYLLRRMLSLQEVDVGVRQRMLELQHRLAHSKSVREDDKRSIIALYHQVIG